MMHASDTRLWCLGGSHAPRYMHSVDASCVAQLQRLQLTMPPLARPCEQSGVAVTTTDALEFASHPVIQAQIPAVIQDVVTALMPPALIASHKQQSSSSDRALAGSGLVTADRATVASPCAPTLACDTNARTAAAPILIRGPALLVEAFSSSLPGTAHVVTEDMSTPFFPGPAPPVGHLHVPPSGMEAQLCQIRTSRERRVNSTKKPSRAACDRRSRKQTPSSTGSDPLTGSSSSDVNERVSTALVVSLAAVGQACALAPEEDMAVATGGQASAAQATITALPVAVGLVTQLTTGLETPEQMTTSTSVVARPDTSDRASAAGTVTVASQACALAPEQDTTSTSPRREHTAMAVATGGHVSTDLRSELTTITALPAMAGHVTQLTTRLVEVCVHYARRVGSRQADDHLLGFWCAAADAAQLIRQQVGDRLVTADGHFVHSAWEPAWTAAIELQRDQVSELRVAKAEMQALNGLTRLLLECPHLRFWYPTSLRDFIRTRGYFQGVPDVVRYVFESESLTRRRVEQLYGALKAAVDLFEPANPSAADDELEAEADASPISRRRRAPSVTCRASRLAWLTSNAVDGADFKDLRHWLAQITTLRMMVTRVATEREFMALLDDLEIKWTDGEGFSCRPRDRAHTAWMLTERALRRLFSDAIRLTQPPSPARKRLIETYHDLCLALSAHAASAIDAFHDPLVAVDGWVRIRFSQMDAPEVNKGHVPDNLSEWVAEYCKEKLGAAAAQFQVMWVLPVTLQPHKGHLPPRLLSVVSLFHSLADVGCRNRSLTLKGTGLVLLNRLVVRLGIALADPTTTHGYLNVIPPFWRASFMHWRLTGSLWRDSCRAREDKRGIYDEGAVRAFLTDHSIDIAGLLTKDGIEATEWSDILCRMPTSREQKGHKRPPAYSTLMQSIVNAKRDPVTGIYSEFPQWWGTRRPPEPPSVASARRTAPHRASTKRQKMTPTPLEPGTLTLATDSHSKGTHAHNAVPLGIPNLNGVSCYAIATLTAFTGLDCLRGLLSDSQFPDYVLIAWRSVHSRAITKSFVDLYRARFSNSRNRVKNAFAALCEAFFASGGKPTFFAAPACQEDASEFFARLMAHLSTGFTFAPKLFDAPRLFMVAWNYTMVQQTTCCAEQCALVTETRTPQLDGAWLNVPLVPSSSQLPSECTRAYAKMYLGCPTEANWIRLGDELMKFRTSMGVLQVQVFQIRGEEVEQLFRGQPIVHLQSAWQLLSNSALMADPPLWSSDQAAMMVFAQAIANFEDLAKAQAAVSGVEQRKLAGQAEWSIERQQRMETLQAFLPIASALLALMSPRGIFAYPSLVACLAAFKEQHWLLDAPMCANPECSMRLRRSVLFLREPPAVLMLRIFRDWIGVGTKDCSPLELSTLDQPIDLVGLLDDQSERVLYNVAGLVFHHGNSAHGGHYFTCARASAATPGHWILFDDDKPARMVSHEELSQGRLQGDLALVLLSRGDLDTPQPQMAERLLENERKLLARVDGLSMEGATTFNLCFMWGHKSVIIDTTIEKIVTQLSSYKPLNANNAFPRELWPSGTLLNFALSRGGLVPTMHHDALLWPVMVLTQCYDDLGPAFCASHAMGLRSRFLDASSRTLVSASVRCIVIPFHYQAHFSVFVVRVSRAGPHQAVHMDSWRDSSGHSFAQHRQLVCGIFEELHKASALGLDSCEIENEQLFADKPTPQQGNSTACFFFAGLFASTWLRSPDGTEWQSLCDTQQNADGIWCLLEVWRAQLLDLLRTFDKWIHRQDMHGTGIARSRSYESIGDEDEALANDQLPAPSVLCTEPSPAVGADTSASTSGNDSAIPVPIGDWPEEWSRSCDARLVEVRRHPIRGLGIFAAQPISENTVVAMLHKAKVVSMKRAAAMFKAVDQPGERTIMMRLGAPESWRSDARPDELVEVVLLRIPAAECKQAADLVDADKLFFYLVNSCTGFGDQQPAAQNVIWASAQDLTTTMFESNSGATLFLIALKDIEPGLELLVSYDQRQSKYKSWVKPSVAVLNEEGGLVWELYTSTLYDEDGADDAEPTPHSPQLVRTPRKDGRPSRLLTGRRRYDDAEASIASRDTEVPIAKRRRRKL